MKKTFNKIILLILSFVILFSFASCFNTDFTSGTEKINTIPQNNITYTHLEFGNVIDEGKQAVFLNFSSDYSVTKMEIAGSLLDKSGNSIYSFDSSINFVNPSKIPEFPIRIDASLINDVRSVNFTKITAYTTQEINSKD